MSVQILGKGKKVALKRRHARLRKHISGTPELPRLVVTRSNRHMVAQIIDENEMLDRVVTINRVSKTHKGGRTFSFAALVVVGDGNGTVGVGYGKSREVPAAIAKGQLDAKKHMFTVPRVKGTVTHPVIGHDAAGTVLLRPAAPGTGVIAGGAVRAVMECAGITDVLTKSMGSATAVNVVRATVDALKKLEEPEEIAARRGMSLEEVAPDALLRARAEGIAEARKAREEAQAKAAQKDGE